eukprot:TRINITY_DN34388_c0_g1_i1.p1 TRINITY_DN34388_c0_g1~~TRINITY_DN34388_c0_g1_i1.p1  ORF type:complete len:346 (-),score=45.89 TRINITY_DN34388_c0_g1_i1:269-1219(-)
MCDSSQDYNISEEVAASVLANVQSNGNLRLVKDSSTQRAWQPVLADDARRSFLYVLRSADNDTFSADQLGRWFRELHPSNYEVMRVGAGTKFSSERSVSWTDAQADGEALLRKTAWCTLNSQCTCNYEYSDTNQGRVTSKEMQAVIKEISDVVARLAGLEGRLNSVNLNFYPTGGGVGFHADDESLFDGLARDTAIVSLSLCEQNGTGNLGARRFEVRLKRVFVAHATKGERPPAEKVHAIELRHGDLMTMEGLHQLFYLHSVWPGDVDGRTLPIPTEDPVGHNMEGARINMTWRNIVNHEETCPCAHKRRKTSSG